MTSSYTPAHTNVGILFLVPDVGTSTRERLLISYIFLVQRNTRYMNVRHNADWPNPREKNWASEVVRSAA